MLYVVTFTINIPQMLAYIPYMGPMGMHMHPWPKRSRFEVWLREGSRDGKRTLDRKNMQLCCMARLRLSIAACLFRMQHLAIAPYRIVSKLISKTSWMIPSLNPSHTRYTGISWVLLFIYEVKSSTILLSSCPCLFGTRALSHISRKLIAYTRQLSEGSISLARSWCTSHSWLSRLANVPSADYFVSTHGGTSSNQPDPQCPHTHKHGYITHWSRQLRRQQFCTIFMGQF